jgi:hypothetical protein
MHEDGIDADDQPFAASDEAALDAVATGDGRFASELDTPLPVDGGAACGRSIRLRRAR